MSIVINTHKEQNSTETKEIIYEYDEIGNIIKDEKHSYGYDGRGRLTSIDSNVTYQYNYDNRRVSKTVNGITTYFIYNGHMLIGEYNEKVEPIKEYLYLNSTPIAILADNKTYKIYSDHLDTPRRVADNSTNIIWSWNSKPFGDTMAEEDVDDNNQKFVMNLRFPGQYFDSESGTHYNINRDYNPLTGRYIQSDPIGMCGGLNTFEYVGSNSLVNIDPKGTWFIYFVASGMGYGLGWTYSKWDTWYSTLEGLKHECENRQTNLLNWCNHSTVATQSDCNSFQSEYNIDCLKSIKKIAENAGGLPGVSGGGPIATDIFSPFIGDGISAYNEL